MKIKYYLTIALLTFCNFFTANAQNVLKFDEFELDSTGVNDGRNGDTLFTFFGVTNFNFPVKYNSSFKYWESGWAISNKVDSVTIASDYTRHLYCSKTGDTTTYLVGQQNSYFTMDDVFYLGYRFRFSNTTYAYNSMKFGDFVGKKFGGNSGNDPDYFYIVARGYNNNNITETDTLILADFRNSDNSKDYILHTWDSSNFFSFIDSMSFELFSSDTGQFGINTPVFFVLDSFETYLLENVIHQTLLPAKIAPNPTAKITRVQTTYPIQWVGIADLNGKVLYQSKANGENTVEIEINALPTGTYLLQIVGEKFQSKEKLIVIH